MSPNHFVNLHSPGYQQGTSCKAHQQGTSCKFICHMYHIFYKLPIPTHYPVILVGGVLFLIVLQGFLYIMEINHLSTFMLQIFLPEVVIRLLSDYMLFPWAHDFSETRK